MNEGAIRTETGVGTLDAFRRLNLRVYALEKLVATAIKNGFLIASHADLQDLDYSGSGHTGFASTTALTAHTGNTSNPHSVTYDQVGAPLLYSQASEPTAPSQFAIWYKPSPGGGVGGKWHFCAEDSSGTWNWQEAGEGT